MLKKDQVIFSDMGYVCKICEKDGWLFVTHYFINIAFRKSCPRNEQQRKIQTEKDFFEEIKSAYKLVSF